jgi:YegS/Rv2252/BmrU family lipid kinase
MQASTPSERCALVVNPAAGNGKTGRLLKQFGEELSQTLGDYRLFETHGPGEATALTKEALRDGYTRIVCAGGDGTCFEVVNGFFADGQPINPCASLAILPLGTANDFRKTVGLPEGRSAIPHLASAVVRPIDVGRVTFAGEGAEAKVIYFLNAVHIGLGGEVARRVEATQRKWFGGFLTFLGAVIAVRFTYRPVSMTVTLPDESIEAPFLEIIAANGRYDGGGMRFAPDAKLDDGLLDIVLIGDVGLGASLCNLPRLYRGTIARHPKVRHTRTARMAVASSGKVLVSPDGELAGALPVTVEVLPGALRLVMPVET